MLWFKHMTDMIDDPRIRRVVRKHQALGYAVYNLSVERISKRLTSDSPLPDLEETAEDIAALLNVDTIIVEEVILFCMQIGLFEQNELTGRIVCNKVYKFIEKSQTRNKELRKMIDKYKENHECLRLSQTVSDIPGQSQIVSENPDRREEKRLDKKRREENSLSDEIKEIMSYFNEICGTAYKDTSQKTKSLIQARTNEGFSVEDFKTVIRKKYNSWNDDPKMREYLRPITLFSNKFESYLNSPDSEQKRNFKYPWEDEDDA